MSEAQRETAFLRHCLTYDASSRRQVLEETITQIQRDGRYVRRAVWWMAMLVALAAAGLGYAMVLVDNFPYNIPHLVINSLCAMGLASLICLLTFMGLGIVYRKKLDRLREEGRHLVAALLESRLGKPVAAPGREGQASDRRQEAHQVAAQFDGRADKTGASARS